MKCNCEIDQCIPMKTAGLPAVVYYDQIGNPSGTKIAMTALGHVAPSALHLQADIWFSQFFGGQSPV